LIVRYKESHPQFFTLGRLNDINVQACACDSLYRTMFIGPKPGSLVSPTKMLCTTHGQYHM